MGIRTPVKPEQALGRGVAGNAKALKEMLASIAKTVKPIVDSATAAIEAKLANYLLKTDAANTYSPQGHKHAASDITSGGTTGAGFTVGGNLAATGSVSGAAVSSSGGVSASGAVAGNTGTFNGGLNSTSVYSKTISGTRTATWAQSDGQMGTASSSRRYKQDISPANLDVQAVLAVEVVHYHYINEVRKRDDPSFAEYAGPDYKVATELGVIAEDLHARGLWEFVIYRRESRIEIRTRTVTGTRAVIDEDGEPILDMDGNPTFEPYEFEEEYPAYIDSLAVDENGDPIPEGVHYELLALALFPVVKDHEERIAALEQKLA